MYEFEDDGGGGGRRPVLVGVAALAVVAIGWFGVRPMLDSSSTAASPSSTTTAVVETTAPTTPPTTEPPTTPPTTEPPTTPPTTEPPTTTTEPPTTTTAPPTTVAVAPYPTMPDGTPEPIEAVFDVGVTTLNGQVPTQADADRLAGLALANSRDPAVTTVVNHLTVNPAVPRSIGVRVLELTSARFPEGSATVEMAHAAELNRVVAIMTALPDITVTVVGHADQRGDVAANQELSEQRATAVVDYLVSQGVDSARLAARAVGEADLITLDEDDAALALNRRTEFVFVGLLVGPAG